MFPPQIRLDGKQEEQLNVILRDLFEQHQLDALLKRHLEITRKDYISDLVGGRIEIYRKIIEEMTHRDMIPDLLDAALKERPRNKALYLFARQCGVTGESASTLDEERVIYPENKYVDFDLWVERIKEFLAKVCSIKIADKHTGTGFLIAPCVVMTNYHVVKEVIDGQRSSTEVFCQFDCRISKKGISEGTEYRLLQQGWKVYGSPHHPLEFTQPNVVPSFDQLDFALLRLEEMPIQSSSVHEPLNLSKRKYIHPCTIDHQFLTNTSLHVMHYPLPKDYVPGISSVPLKFSLDTRTILGITQGKTRVQYATSTEKGSSGAPCFSQDWELVALHHAGNTTQKPPYNQGIPMITIIRHLDAHNMLHLLGLDATAIPDLHSSSSVDDYLATEGETGHVLPHSATPVSFASQIQLTLKAVEANIREAQKPFADGGTVRERQYTVAVGKLEAVKAHMQELSTLLDGYHPLPEYCPDRGTLDTDISIVRADSDALIQLLHDRKPHNDIQNGFVQLESSFDRITNGMSERG